MTNKAEAVPGEHEQKITIQVDVFVPDHPDRTTTPIFAHSRKQLISDNPDACCEACGSKEDLELHHALVEWCDSDGVDWDKVKLSAPEFDWGTFDPAHPETFIDSTRNAKQVLCKKHHTGQDHGIHYLPYPMWQMQKHKKESFVFAPDEIKKL
jgi:hypothetical protein